MGEMVRVEGLDEAVKRVKSLMSSLEPNDVEKVLLRGARIVRDEAKRRAPVKTGALRRSIKAKKAKRRGRLITCALAAQDYRIARHAHLVEYGTSRAPAHPFFRPAYEAVKGQVADEVQKGLKELLERGAKK